jgi:hypothetical protein
MTVITIAIREEKEEMIDHDRDQRQAKEKVDLHVACRRTGRK